MPEVFPALRAAFDKEKPSADFGDQAMFDQEVLGRAMFYNRVHGSCTSSAVLIATVFRALGIPTRIVFCVPPADANDARQVQMLLNAVHHNRVRATIRHGLPPEAPSGSGDFSNHLFKRSLRGQPLGAAELRCAGAEHARRFVFRAADPHPDHHQRERGSAGRDLGHALCHVSEGRAGTVVDQPIPPAEGFRPFGTQSRIANPAVENEELRKVTVVETYWKDALPAAVSALLEDPTGSDFYIGIREYIPGYRLQMRAFPRQAGHQFVLSAQGHPDVKVTLTSMKFSAGVGGRRYQLFGAHAWMRNRARRWRRGGVYDPRL